VLPALRFSKVLSAVTPFFNLSGQEMAEENIGVREEECCLMKEIHHDQLSYLYSSSNGTRGSVVG
jgi:hypothetical protein